MSAAHGSSSVAASLSSKAFVVVVLAWLGLRVTRMDRVSSVSESGSGSDLSSPIKHWSKLDPQPRGGHRERGKREKLRRMDRDSGRGDKVEALSVASGV